MKIKLQQQRRSLRLPHAAFAYEFQQLQQFSVTFLILRAVKCSLTHSYYHIWYTHITYNSCTLTHTQIYRLQVLYSSKSWLAFELWLSSAVTWLKRELYAINICYVCITHKTFARDLQMAWKTLHFSWLWAHAKGNENPNATLKGNGEGGGKVRGMGMQKQMDCKLIQLNSNIKLLSTSWNLAK